MIAKLTEALGASSSLMPVELAASSANGATPNADELVRAAPAGSTQNPDMSSFSLILRGVTPTPARDLAPPDGALVDPQLELDDPPVEPQRQTSKPLPDVVQFLPQEGKGKPEPSPSHPGEVQTPAAPPAPGEETVEDAPARPKLAAHSEPAATVVDSKPPSRSFERSANGSGRAAPEGITAEDAAMPDRVELTREYPTETSPKTAVQDIEHPEPDQELSLDEPDDRPAPAAKDPIAGTVADLPEVADIGARVPTASAIPANLRSKDGAAAMVRRVVRSQPVTDKAPPRVLTPGEHPQRRPVNSKLSEPAPILAGAKEQLANILAEPPTAAQAQQPGAQAQLTAPVLSVNAAPPQSFTGVQAATPTAPIAAQVEAVIEQLDSVREAARAARPELTVRHSEFGAVHIRLEGVGTDLRATLSARDPGFAPAIQAALSERAVAPSAEAAAGGGQRGSEGNAGQSATQSHNWQGASASSDPRYGSSPGSGQGSSQPYFDNQERERRDAASRDREDGEYHLSQASRERGLFA